jgi:hypothetical protein
LICVAAKMVSKVPSAPFTIVGSKAFVTVLYEKES